MTGDDVRYRLTRALAGRYAVSREIDRGGMAIVYLADDLRHRRQVAIKVLQPVLTATLATDRFLREIDVTPLADKKCVTYPGAHFIPRSVLVGNALDWFDRYLGPVQ